jgi:eukaryotic-like serine/threonine-protein kinase
MGHGTRLAASRARGMTPERWQRVKTLFSATLDVAPHERPAFLALESQGDEAMIDEVATLLASHEAPGEFLEALPPNLRTQAFAAADHVGERIGAYRIVGMLGTGGMGDVLRGVRDDDQYRAEVAIKLMRADLRDSFAEQRFRTERQILARLDHRNIARLLDGGTTPAGLPYVVMELVHGEPIDQYCETRKLPVRERVQLFLQVCAAVSYAHQHLVVHRDLKPNNILVTTDGSVKLLDFGIAKLLEANTIVAGAGDETRTQFRAMTLDYASPEQVGGGTVTTVSDVYSLGVVLYRLLTGQSPYGKRTNDAQRMKEILSDTAPTRPSQMRAADRSARDIDADLDNILLMALRKEPQARYGSVEQFANDLRNFLGGLPVQARGNAWRYRFGKFLRRRKIEIAAAVVVVASLVVGLGVAIHEARVAEQQRVIAQRHFDSVRKLANRLFVFHDEVAQLPGSTKAREMLVKTSLEYLDALYKESGTDRALQEELGIAYKKVADIQGSTISANVGDTAGAMRSYANAVALLEPLHESEPANGRIGTILAKTYFQQTSRTIYVSGPEAALPIIRKAVALSEALQSVLSDDFERMGLLGNAYSGEAEVLGLLGRMPEARDSLEKMVSACEEYARFHPKDQRGLMSLGAAYGNSAVIGSRGLSPQDAYARSVTLLQKGMAADEALLALKPDNASYRLSLAETRLNVADLYYSHGDYARAIALNRQAAAVFAQRDPGDSRTQLNSAINDISLAKSLARSGGTAEAETLFAAAGKSLRDVSARGEDLQVDYALADLDIRRGEMYVELARHDEARRLLERGLSGVKKVLAAMPDDETVQRLLADGTAALARAKG